MRCVVIGVMAMLLCASAAANNLGGDLQSYINYLLQSNQKSLVGQYLPSLAPKLDLKRLVELIRGQMTKPFPVLGLPILEPLQMEITPFDVDHDIGRYQGYFENFTVRHLSRFEVEHLVLNVVDLKADFNFSFKKLPLTAQYKFSGSFANSVPTWGEGDLQLEAHDMKVFGSVKVGTDREHLYMESFNMDFIIRHVTGEIRGLHGGGELGEVLSEVVVEVAPVLADTVRPELRKWLSQQFLEQSNRRFTDLAIQKTGVLEWLRKAATHNILSWNRTRKRDLSSVCDARTSLTSVSTAKS